MTMFTNATGITIVDDGIESQTLDVSGLAPSVVNVSVTFNGLSHTYVSDLDFLLVGPNGVANLDFWSNAGADQSLSAFDVTVSDTGASPIPQTSTIVSGTVYRPADYGAAEDGSVWGIALAPIKHPTTNGGATFGSAFAAT